MLKPMGKKIFKNEQKLPKMEYIIPNFLVLHTVVKFHKNPNKNAKVTDSWKFA